MARGDAIVSGATLSGAQAWTLQPSGTEEWIIHNVYHGNDVDVRISSATGYVIAGSNSGEGSLAKYQWHITNSQYMVIKNTTSAAVADEYMIDGIVSQT